VPWRGTADADAVGRDRMVMVVVVIGGWAIDESAVF